MGTHEIGHGHIATHHNACVMKGTPEIIYIDDYVGFVKAIDAMPEEFCQPCKNVIAASTSVNLDQRV